RPFHFNIDGIAVRDARIRLDDAPNQRQIEFAVARLETGRIASGVPSRLTLDAKVKTNRPALDAGLSFKTGFTPDLVQNHHVLRDLNVSFTGTLDAQPFEAGLNTAALSLTGDQLSAGMLHIQFKSGKSGSAALE